MIPEKMKETHKKIDVLNNLFYGIDVTINKFFDVIYWDSLSQRGLCISTTHTSQHGIAKQTDQETCCLTRLRQSLYVTKLPKTLTNWLWWKYCGPTAMLSFSPLPSPMPIPTYILYRFEIKYWYYTIMDDRITIAIEMINMMNNSF